MSCWVAVLAVEAHYQTRLRQSMRSHAARTDGEFANLLKFWIPTNSPD